MNRGMWLATGLVAVLMTHTSLRAETPPVRLASAAPQLPADYPAIAVAPKGAPNILLVLTDDVGFGAASAFGGPVPTPNLERLATSGLTYSRFHTTAMCSPTRAALLTGRNHHAVGSGALTDFPMGAPGYSGMIPPSAATIASVLRGGGYSTAFFGKHHNVPKGPFQSSGPFDYLPNRLGFDYFFGFIGSDTDQWRPTLYRNESRLVDEEPHPILDQRLADAAIHWVHQQKGGNPQRPFFVYFAPGSAHTPHQAPADWIARFKGRFDEGWNVARDQTLARQKQLGLVPRNARLPVWPADVPAWSALAPEEKAFQARMMEVFAAQLAFQDAQFGRILDELERMGERDNTLIVFIEGDNGPDAAASPAGVLSEAGELANRRLTPQEHWQMIDKLGGRDVGSNYGTGWAQAMATPFPYYKQIASQLGGTSNGMVLSWPRRIEARGIRSQYSHVIDVFPTLLTAAGIAAPATVGGVSQQPIDGTDLTYSFADAAAPGRHSVQYYEMLGNRAIYADGWLAATYPERRPWAMASGNDAAINKAPGYTWGLYDMRRDFNQTTDVAAKYPERLAEMRVLFDREAARYHVDPVNDRTDWGRAGSQTRAYVEPRDRFVYWGKGLMFDTDIAPSLAARSFTITAEVTPGDGVLVATGSSLGGWSFSVENGKPTVHHALTPMPADKFTLASPERLKSAGPSQITFRFDYDGGGPGKGGTIAILIDGRQVASSHIDRTILIPTPHSESFDIGVDTGVPVADYATPSGAFAGHIDKIVIDLAPPGAKGAAGAH